MQTDALLLWRGREALNPHIIMRRGLTFVVLIVGLILPASAFAQFRERIKITNVRVGYTPGPGVGRNLAAFKAGQWTPVYVDLECTREIPDNEKLLLVVETKDTDGAITEGAVEIRPLQKGDQFKASELGRIPYLKMGSSSAEVAVRVKGAESGRTYGEMSDRTFSGLEAPMFLILGIGTNLNGIRFPQNVQGGVEEGPASHGGWIQTANITDVGMLPDQWLGYGSVDLMILGTGVDKAFWESLADAQHARQRKAIVEWVRRGGRLIVSVGANADLLDAVKELKDILPATIQPGSKKMITDLAYNWTAANVNDRGGNLQASEFPVVAIQPRADRPTHVILDNNAGRPWAVQGSHGLGRVTLFAFDFDRPPFTEWPKRPPFWENIINFAGHSLPAGSLNINRYGSSNKYDEFSQQLQGSLDYFEGVPVVSFGWVALFILIYIVLIGPIDYLFLKKVVRKLEWTWITFPVIVITVSAGAYFAAYALKGKDLKINKVDVVDVDLAGKRVDGNTWFTLFSPRIQNYTIGVEPAGSTGEPSAWTPASSADAARETVLSWHSYIEPGGYNAGRGGYLSKHYQFQSGIDPVDVNRDLYAAGLERVPIQVWTTKAFHAQWSASIDPAKPPIAVELTRDGDAIVGSIVNNLEVQQFTDAALIWRGQAFPQPLALPTGVPIAISDSAGRGKGTSEDLKNWVSKRLADSGGSGQKYSEYGTTTQPKFRLWEILFADLAADTKRAQAPNASLRKLDQSWRVSSDQPEQAILVLRIATHEGQAEETTRSPDSPSRLWLGELPTSGAKRPALQGTLKQETYIRVFVPVQNRKR